jgi:phage terminase small subunit
LREGEYRGREKHCSGTVSEATRKLTGNNEGREATMTKNDKQEPENEQRAVVTTTDDLNDRQRRFVAEYLVDLNATAAYLRAGYTPSTMAVASANASELLSQPKIQLAVHQRQAQIDRGLGISTERIERQTSRIAFSDIRDVVTIHEDGSATVKPSDEWSDAAAAAVASITITEYKGQTKVTVKMVDKLAALEQLYKRQNLYREHQEAGGEALADVFAAGLKAGARLQATVSTIAQSEPEQLPSSIEGDFREAEADTFSEK